MKGKDIEDNAVEYLIKNGFKILTRNYRIKGGEIDIIAIDKDTLVFIEVKGRKNNFYGYPEEYITKNKKEKIYKTIQNYFSKNCPKQKNFRFDVFSKCGKDIKYYKNVSIFNINF